MLMDAEDAKAMSDNLKRELKNIKAAQTSERKRIIKIIKSFPVGDLVSMGCTNADDFPRFINVFVKRLVKEITSSVQEAKK